MDNTLNNLSKQDCADLLKYKLYPCQIKLNKRFVKALKEFNEKYNIDPTVN